MPLGEILYEPGGQLQHAYFPTTSIVSLHYVMKSGPCGDPGVGNEGVVGTRSSWEGHHAKLGRGADRGPRLPAGTPLVEAGIRSRRLDAGLVAALHAGADYADDPDRTPFGGAASSAAQAVVDTRSSPLAWIMTQELVAGMLGVRRRSIAEAAGNLQRAGIIRYRRGHIAVLDGRTGDPRVRVLRRGQEENGPRVLEMSVPPKSPSQVDANMRPDTDSSMDGRAALEGIQSLPRHARLHRSGEGVDSLRSAMESGTAVRLILNPAFGPRPALSVPPVPLCKRMRDAHRAHRRDPSLRTRAPERRGLGDLNESAGARGGARLCEIAAPLRN